jgi:2-keto-4-pentenoate hydratase/2-oxohepta-3-ene-1,7-dioic acid hydratase in catechol pathway
MVTPQDAVFVDDVVPTIDRKTLSAGALDTLAQIDISARKSVNVSQERFGPPLESPTKIVCIGLNYRAHALESGADIPTEPVIFMKSPDTLQGPNDPIVVPPGSTHTDYEVELAIVVGREALYLPSAAAAKDVIAGFAISQDVSERHWQLERGGTWDKGKSFPTFNPFGPFLVTPDEFDPSDQGLRCTVNNEVRQHSRTSDLIFDCYEIVRYVSNVMALSPGDIINTGTP